MARGNEKGVVEGLVKYARLNFFVPVPQVPDFEQLNLRLSGQCVEDRERRLRGRPGSKTLLLAEDQAAFLPLPATPFEACRQVSTRANSQTEALQLGMMSILLIWRHWRNIVKLASGKETKIGEAGRPPRRPTRPGSMAPTTGRAASPSISPTASSRRRRAPTRP